MASNDSQIDWAKAAAAWASQRREGILPTPAPAAPRPQQQGVPFSMMPHGFPMAMPGGMAGSVPGMHPLSMMFSHQMGNMPGAPAMRPMGALAQTPSNNLMGPPFLPTMSTPGAGPPGLAFAPPGYMNLTFRPASSPYYGGVSGAPQQQTQSQPQTQPQQLYSSKASAADRNCCVRADPVIQATAAVSSPAIPLWLKEAAKTAGAAQNSLSQSLQNSSVADNQETAETESALLTPTDNVPLEAISNADEAEASKEHLAAVKDRVTQIILRATDLVLDEIAHDVLEEEKEQSISAAASYNSAVFAQQPSSGPVGFLATAGSLPPTVASVSSSAVLPSHHALQQQSQHPLAPHHMHPPLLPSPRQQHPGLLHHPQLHHPGGPHPLILGVSAPAPPLHLQLVPPASLSSRRSYGPPVPDPTLEVDEEIVDERTAMDNGGMPFINPDEPTKGLFRSPPDGLIVPLCQSEALKNAEGVDRVPTSASEDVSSSPETPVDGASYVKIVTYSQDGQVLGSVLLNGRKCVVIGSNPNQAHVLDSHTSVYSQHCAIAVCCKGKASSKSNLQPCALFLFPLGGSTKVLKPEQVSFIRQMKQDEEKAAATKEAEERNANESTLLEQYQQEENTDLNDGAQKAVPLAQENTGNVCEISKEGGDDYDDEVLVKNNGVAPPVENARAVFGTEEVSIERHDRDAKPTEQSGEENNERSSHEQEVTEERGLMKGNKRSLAPPALPLPKITKPVDPAGPVEVLMDAGRKREVPVKTQLYLQLGSSRRYYLIDASHWDVAFVQTDGTQEHPRFCSAASAERELAAVEEREKHRRRDSDSRRISRSRSISSLRSSRRHSRRRRASSRSVSLAARSRDNRDDRRIGRGSHRYERSVSRSAGRYSRHHRSHHRHHRHRSHHSSSRSPRSSRTHGDRDHEMARKRRKSFSSNEGYASDHYVRRRKHRNE